MGRAPCCDKTSVKKGPWSPEEDAWLKAYIEEHGTGGNWIALPQKIGLKRCGKSCRLRWLNYLRPNLKHGGFSEEEDQIICSLYISIGSRWSIIAAQLPGRTDNDIKNYWNTKLKKKLLGKRRESSQSKRLIPIDHDQEVNNQTNLLPLSTSALVRMQLHMQLQGLYNPFSSSFHDHNPSLWHNHDPPQLSQQSTAEAVAASPVPQALGMSTAVLIQQSHHQDAFANGSFNEILSSTANIQEGLDSSSKVGFHSPTLSSCTGGGGTPNCSVEISSNSKFDSFALEMQDDHDHQLSDLDSYKEILYGDHHQKESMSTWWPSNGFQDSASVDLQPELMLQEYYSQQYDIYKHRADHYSNYKLE